MRCNNVLGLIFAGTLDEKMPDLTSSRTMASVPIGGKYRIIDFVLSNMSNSGINNVGVVATKNYLSLADHLGSGSAYDLSKRRSQLTLLTPYNGSSFSSALKEQGADFRGAGENIAWGQQTPKEVMNAWMNSPGHRANILNKNFKYIGVGNLQNSSGAQYWVQLFKY